MSEVDVRFYGGVAITRRLSDGYFDATSMCKACCKRWADYHRLESTAFVLQRISRETGLPVNGPSGVYQFAPGGIYRGTWVHPEVAKDIAVWLGEPFTTKFFGAWWRDLQGNEPTQLEVIDVAAVTEPVEPETPAEEVAPAEEVTVIQLAGSEEYETRYWNKTPITRRITDGYVDATAMCKSCGKRWNDFYRLDSTQRYLTSVQTVAGNPATPAPSLVQAAQGGSEQGTWVHPDVATELARWLDSDLAVFVNRWFRYSLERGALAPVAAAPAVPAPLGPAETLSLIERGFSLLERFGTASDLDRLQFSDLVRNTLNSNGGVQALPGSESHGALTIQEEPHLGLSVGWYKVTKQRISAGDASLLGKRVAALYREEFNCEPARRFESVNGNMVEVNSYRASWLLRTLQRIAEEGLSSPKSEKPNLRLLP